MKNKNLNQNNNRIYFENLDGLRFLSFLSVFLYHAFHTDYDYISSSNWYRFIKWDIFGNGNLGVNFFFVLSGFLITYLLIEEKRTRKNINIPYFWMRRMLRIWPLFYSCVFFGFYIFPILKSYFGQVPNETASIVYYLTFTNNFDFIQKGLPDASVLGVLWSVAVEEQFYIFWPLFLFALPIPKQWVAFVFVILVSIVFRIFAYNHSAFEHHTLSCIGDMAVGGFGAWLIQTKGKFKAFIIEINSKWIYTIYLIFIIIFFFRDEIIGLNVFAINVLERMVIATVILMILLEQCFAKSSFYKMANAKRISRWGTISYGLYCLHFIGFLITTTITKKLGLNTEWWQVLILDTGLAFVITVGLATCSFIILEKPFLKLKDSFAFILTTKRV